MAKTSSLGYYWPIDLDHLDADEPIDTRATWTLFNNASHLYDVCPQYRVNWCMHNPQSDFNVLTRTDQDAAGVRRPYTVEFPITIKAAGYPVALDVRLGIYIASSAAATHTCKWVVKVGDIITHTGSGTTTSTSGSEWIYDGQVVAAAKVADAKTTSPLAGAGYTVIPDGAIYYQARLQVFLKSTDASAVIYTNACMVREYMG